MMTEEIDDDDEEDIILDRTNLHTALSSSGPKVVFDLSQKNFGIFHNANQLSKRKTVTLALTCICIGMLTGLLGPTFLYLSQNMFTELSSVIWLIAVKAIGFLIATVLSSYLYTWFNVYCVLGLSCLSISFAVCSLPFIIDLMSFYLISLTLGIGLGLSYNGIDALYSRVWTHPSISSIRWLHLLVSVGTILSTLALFPSMASNEITSPTLIKESLRPRRVIANNTELLANLRNSNCFKAFCCFDQSHIFLCQKNETNSPNDCKTIYSSCQNSSLSNICYINSTNTSCRIDQFCSSDSKLICSKQLIDAAMNKTDFFSTSTTTNIMPSSTSHHTKPPTADSDKDDLSKNFLYEKLRLFFHSITLISSIYLLISIVFFLLGIFYSIIAIQGENFDLSSMKYFNPLSLLFIQPHRIINNSRRDVSLLSDYSSIKFVLLLVLFYFILSGIESSCTYLTYLFGKEFRLSKRQSLLLQFCYLFGRLIDILFNQLWFLFNKYFKTQSDFMSIKSLILFRLIILFLICVSNLFREKFYYFVFTSIGLLLTSLPSLILYWIERDLSLNDLLLRIILYTILISEIIFPIVIFYKLEYFLQYYLLISLSLLIFLFIIIVYSSRKWQRNRSYRLLPISMEIDAENDIEEDSNNEL